MIFIKINSMYINQLQDIHDLQIAYKTTSRYSSSSITCKQLAKLLPSSSSSSSSCIPPFGNNCKTVMGKSHKANYSRGVLSLLDWTEYKVFIKHFFLKIARIFFYRIPHAYRSMVKIFGSPIPLGGVTRNYWQTIRKKSICRGD